MSERTASEALEYALDEAFLKLYGVTCTGVLFGLLGAVAIVRGGANGLALLFVLLAPPVVLVGLVAIAAKLLAESP